MYFEQLPAKRCSFS